MEKVELFGILLLLNNAIQILLIDQFTNKKTGRLSHAYRITYRHMDKSLTNKEVDDIQTIVRLRLVDKLQVELR